jgi:hypothetical protein
MQDRLASGWNNGHVSAFWLCVLVYAVKLTESFEVHGTVFLCLRQHQHASSHLYSLLYCVAPGNSDNC